MMFTKNILLISAAVGISWGTSWGAIATDDAVDAPSSSEIGYAQDFSPDGDNALEERVFNNGGNVGSEVAPNDGGGQDSLFFVYPVLGNQATEVLQTFWQLADADLRYGSQYHMHTGLDLSNDDFMKDPDHTDLGLYMPFSGVYKKFKDPIENNNHHPNNYIVIKKQGTDNWRVYYGHVYVTASSENWVSADAGDLIGFAAEPEFWPHNWKTWGCCHVHVEIDAGDPAYSSTKVYNPLLYGGPVSGVDTQDPKNFGGTEMESWPMERFPESTPKGWKVYVDDQTIPGFTNNFVYSCKLFGDYLGNNLITDWRLESFFRNLYDNPEMFIYTGTQKKIITSLTDSKPNINNPGIGSRVWEMKDIHDTYAFIYDCGDGGIQEGYLAHISDAAHNKLIVQRPGAPVEEGPEPQPPYLGNWPKENFPTQPYLWEYPIISAAAVANVDYSGHPTLRDKEIVYCKRDSTVGGFGIHLLDSDASTIAMKNPEGVFSFMGSPVIADLDNDGAMEIIAVGNGSVKGRVYIFDHWLNYEAENRYYLLDAKTDATPSVGDINGDGKPDIVIGDDVHNVYVIGFDGNNFNLIWKRGLGAPVKKAVAIGDIDFDGELEIAAIGYNKTAKQTIVKVWDSDGTELNGGWTRTFNHPSEDDIAKNNEIMLADFDKDGDLEVIFGLGYHYMPPYPHPAIRIYDQNNVQFGGSPITTWTNGSILIGDYNGDGHQELAVANNTEFHSEEIEFLNPITGAQKFSAPLKHYNIDNAAIIGDVDMPAFDPQNYPEVIYPGYILSRQPYLNTKNNLWGANFHPGDKPPQFPSLPQYGEEEWCCPLGLWDPTHNYGEGAWWHYGAVAPPKIADINLDGTNEIIIGDMRATMHVYDTAGTKSQLDYDFEWGEFQHDALNTGNYEVFPPISVTVYDTPDDQGHSLTVEWLASIDDKIYGNRSRRAYRYQVYRANATEIPLTFVNAGYLVAGESGPMGFYTFVDDNPSIQPTMPYCYYVVSKTVAYGSPPLRRRSTPSLKWTATAHDDIPPDPPTNFAGEVLDDGAGNIFVHLTWDLSPDDPNYSPGEPDDGSDSAANVRVTSTTGRKPGGPLAAVGHRPGDDSPPTVTFPSLRTNKPAYFPFSDKEGEAFKTKASTKTHGTGDYGTPAPIPSSDVEPADGGLDAGANDVQYYYIWKKEDGIGIPEPLVILEAGTSVFDDPYVEYGHVYDYTIHAKDSENYSEGCGPIFIDLTRLPGDSGPLALAPDPGSVSGPSHNQLDGSSAAAAPFADTGWGAGRVKPAKVITCKPNPVTGTATFTIKPSKPTHAKIDIYDLAGRKVETVFDKYVTAAGATATWTPSVTPGLYLYALRIGSERHVGKVVVGR